MPLRMSSAVWEGTLREGTGSLRVGDGKFEGNYTYGSRFEQEKGTNPEELIGAAHAGCFSMALAGELGKAGFNPQSISTKANVHLEKLDGGWTITNVELVTEADVPDISEDKFRELAETAKRNCPVSRALATDITLNAKLVH